MVVDQSTDSVMAHLARRVADRPKLAQALGHVDVDVDEISRLPDTAFAWPEKRAYPIHSPGHALMSCAYREGADGVPSHVDATLKEALDVYGVDASVLARPKVAAAPASDDDFLLPAIRRLRVTAPGHVKAAEAKLLEEGGRLDLPMLALASARLVHKAAFYGVPLRPETRKMAGMTVTDTRVLRDWIEARQEAAPPDHKDGFRKLAASVSRLPSELRDRAVQVKLAGALHELDEMAGLDRHYGRRLPDPMSTVFNTDKVAGQGVTLAGRFLPLERLASFDPSFYSDVLGPDIVREASDGSGGLDVQRLAQVIETLPVDMQRCLSAQIR